MASAKLEGIGYEIISRKQHGGYIVAKAGGTPDCSYARFVREKFPWVWERYVKGQE